MNTQTSIYNRNVRAMKTIHDSHRKFLKNKTVRKVTYADDEQIEQNPQAGGQVRQENTLTAQRLRIAERIMNNDSRQTVETKDPQSYGMPSENPPAKIPNSRGQSGSSGVYRVNVGTLTQSIPSPFEKWVEEILSAKSLNHTGKGYRCRDCGSIVSDDSEASFHTEKGCTSGFDLVK